MNTETNTRMAIVVLTTVLLPSTLFAQRSADEIMAAYRAGDAGPGTNDFTIEFLCQRQAPRTREALDDLANRLVDFAVDESEGRALRDVALSLSIAGSPPAGLEDCVPYEGAWEALIGLHEGTDLDFDYLLALDVQRGVGFALDVLPQMNPTEDRRRLCRLLAHADYAGELTLRSDGSLAFTTEIEGRYDVPGGGASAPSIRTQVLAEELMLGGFIRKTGWPWSPCLGPGTRGIVRVMAEDGTWLPPDTSWADIQDKRGFHLSPTGDTLRVLKRVGGDPGSANVGRAHRRPTL